MNASPLLHQANTYPGVIERHMAFTSNGDTLHGILSVPADNAIFKKTAIILSHGWSGNRCGPTELLTLMARRLAADGYPTFRFDYAGRGESEGEGLKTTLKSMAQNFQDAVKAAMEQSQAKEVIYLGLCSGGNVIIGTLDRLPKPKSLLLLSVYPFSDGDTFGKDVHRTLHLLQSYFRKACSFQSWKRLFTGDASLGRVLGVLTGSFRRHKQNASHEGQTHQPKPVQNTRASAVEGRKDVEHAPKEHLKKLPANAPILMIYGSADPDALGAEKYYGDFAAEHKLNLTFLHIDGANHNFSTISWRSRLTDGILSFLKEKQQY